MTVNLDLIVNKPLNNEVLISLCLLALKIGNACISLLVNLVTGAPLVY